MSSYTLFFLLVSFHIYAMIHQNLSAGYYSRYSYLFIPVFFTVVPSLLFKMLELIRAKRVQHALSWIMACVLMFVIIPPFPTLLQNWKKSYDDEFAEIWIQNAGFDDTTYLIGGFTKNAFQYYTEKYNYQGKGEILSADSIDSDQLPDSFWLWRSNWASNKWQETIDAAEKQGYDVVVFYNVNGVTQPESNKYQLAFCTAKNTNDDSG